MRKDNLKYLALCLFLVGVITIVFLLFISGQNNDRLIQSNKRLLDEVAIQNNLRELEADILTVESDIRGLVITNSTTYLPGVRQKINNIQGGLNFLKNSQKYKKNKKDVTDLNELIHAKIAFSYNVLSAFENGGKAEAEKIINSDRGKILRDSITIVISYLDKERHKELVLISNSIEINSSKAQTWGLIIAAIACIICVLAFLYIVKLGREQQQMIVKLNESEKEIKEAAEIKQQFLANMSHEIRTPVNAILGFTTLLDKTTLNTEQKKYLSFIHSSGEDLLTIINDILDLSKIEAGMMHFENAPFSLNGLLSSIEIMFREKAKEKNLLFNVFTPSTKYDTFYGDAVRLTQILMNLLSNAIKFTQKGFVELHVRILEESENTVRMQFCVVDSGIGIAAEKQQLVFARFQQAEAETTRRFGGTGLGLSIVKQLVDLQQGTIELESEVEKGSEFKVTLAFAPVTDKAQIILKHSKEDGEVLKNVKILIADDNRMNQQLMIHLMRQWQLDYVLVNNGLEVLDVLKKEKFSLILMDIQMPEMDGYSTALTIRNDLRSDIPIIAMTAHAMSGEKEKCLGLGMNDYLSKPLKEQDLYNIIKYYARDNPVEENGNTPVIDLAYLHELSNGDAEFEQIIIRQFILQVPEELELLKEAIVKKNLAKIKSIAHGIKSSVGYMGLANRLYPFLQRMEQEAVQLNSEFHFREDFDKIDMICRKAITEARQLVSAVYAEQRG
ncbi:MAG: ATP-binding protein [Chitinophagaceae bacterium]